MKRDVFIPFEYHRYIIGQKGREIRTLMEDHNLNIAIPASEKKVGIKLGSVSCIPLEVPLIAVGIIVSLCLVAVVWYPIIAVTWINTPSSVLCAYDTVNGILDLAGQTVD